MIARARIVRVERMAFMVDLLVVVEGMDGAVDGLNTGVVDGLLVQTLRDISQVQVQVWSRYAFGDVRLEILIGSGVVRS
jgi:hypothetical protein